MREGSSNEKEKSVEKIYQKKSLLEQILLRPDTYIGSIEANDQNMWVYDKASKHIVYKKIKFVPGLYKIFDEILVNAADNVQRDKSMTYLKVDINPTEKYISVCNNGKGIPCKIHKEHNVYVAGLIFGELLTSSNYNDDEKKVTGGRNGYGAKLANIFSTKFIVEAADGREKKIFRQVFSNNMKDHEEPTIKSYTGSDFTKITFYPDLKRFQLELFDDDILSLFTKRVYDMAGITPSSVNVFLNGEKLIVKDFKSYMEMYIELTDETPLFTYVTDRWEVYLTFTDGEFRQVSFANAISTIKGGTHVNHITDQIVEKVTEKIRKKHKEWVIKAHQVKAHLWIFVNALIENPAFDSQTKETLTLKQSNFGSKCILPDEFFKKLFKSNLIDMITKVEEAREQVKLTKGMGGKKVGRILNIEKLEDANNAGGKNSDKCMLILTEGDSAKGLAMNGIEIVGRDNYGVFPLRGKLLNVQDASPQKLTENEEIQNLMKIVGLKIGEVYDSIKSLRYGGIMIMTDQDVDGSHIKGLIINFIQFFWPSLFAMKGFLKEFITPLIKATKNQDVRQFFCMGDYEKWIKENNSKNYKIKYYKGLGTSSPAEAKEYFTNIARHKIEFEYYGNEDKDAFNLAFGKKQANERKTWLSNYNKEVNVDIRSGKIKFTDFINKELIHFSIYDNDRSIPCLCDGLKPGQRKILYCAFKKKLFQEIKVAQFSGYVSEHSAYHHGEQSLAQTIVGMAQNFVGSNNIHIFDPLGQFGSRAMGGKDAASSRYICTKLSKITRTIFREEDDKLMTYLIEEGQSIEPEWYLPVIPMVLVNGSEGIGTGWSTCIPCYNPMDLVKCIRDKLDGKPLTMIHPWYRNYIGSIVPSEKGYLVMGKYTTKGENVIDILELPLQKWTSDYKMFLVDLIKDESQPLLEFKEYHQGDRIHFTCFFDNDKGKELLGSDSSIVKALKLHGKISTNNFVLFDSQHRIKRYDSVLEIINEFCELRLDYYNKRKLMQIKHISKELDMLRNKVRFITEIIEDKLDIKKKPKKVVMKLLKDAGYKPQSAFEDAEEKKRELFLTEENKKNNEGNPEASAVEEEPDIESLNLKANDYDYLCNMSLWTITLEKTTELINKMKNLEGQLQHTRATSPEEMWRIDLKNFVIAYDEITKLESEEEAKGKKKNNKINYDFDVEKLKKAKSRLADADKKEKEKGKGKKKKGGKEGKEGKEKSKKVPQSANKSTVKRGRNKKKDDAASESSELSEQTQSKSVASTARKRKPKKTDEEHESDSSYSFEAPKKKASKKKKAKKEDSSVKKEDSSVDQDSDESNSNKIKDDPKIQNKKLKGAVSSGLNEDIHKFLGPPSVSIEEAKKKDSNVPEKKASALSGKKYTIT